MRLTLRAYDDDADYWQIRDFLREAFRLNGRRELCWQVYRWDYWRWHGVENIERFALEENVFLWETADGRIIAVLHPESRSDAFLQVHPDHRTPELQQAMLAIAEERYGELVDGHRELTVWVHQGDVTLAELLTEQGYAVGAWPEYQRHQTIPEPPAIVAVPDGYTVRALGDRDELPARSWLSWKAFHPDEPDERYEGWEWYTNIQRCPLYRRDLDLVAVSAEGELAAFCTVWFDDANRTAAFEPVGTHPGHQRRGLGKAIMAEGLRRARRLGATTACVGSYSAEAHALYASTGFTAYELSRPWSKAL
jgi:mycothiol synthase